MNGFDETLLHSASESVFFFLFLSRSLLALHMVAHILCTYILATAMPREWTNDAATIAERKLKGKACAVAGGCFRLEG